jgi:AAA+ ATPase superfamily predicted ATPase
MDNYTWAAAGEFVDRTTELSALESWWNASDRTPMSVYGRRRCGKSWLLRRFAHGKPAVVLVAMRTAPGAQLDDFSERLEPLLGARPRLNDLADLFRVLFRAAQRQKLLVVIDEFPYLLPTTEAEIERQLTAIAAVWEQERDSSKLKLILCGSLIAQMQDLLAERSPLHGRLQPLHLHPVPFAQARLFMPKVTEPLASFERFSITGGMPRYLSALGGPQPVAGAVCERVLDPNGALFNEGRTVLEELREPKVYFSVLQSLAGGDKQSAEIVSALRSDPQKASKYLAVLEQMRLVERRLPTGAPSTARTGHWHLRDPFLRFWFRYVFPFQDDLETGLAPRDLWDTEIAPTLADHVAPEFEEHSRAWVRATQGVTSVAAWWGNALDPLRRQGVRSSEEIDIVGSARHRVTHVGEARWRKEPMGLSYLSEIEEYKIPALRQSSLKVATSVRIVLVSRAGFTAQLQDIAQRRGDLTLVDGPTALAPLA